MNISKLCEEGANVYVTISATDLKEFFIEMAMQAQAEREQREEENPTIIDRDEAVKYLGVSYTTLWRWDKENYLKPIRKGKQVLYNMSDLKAIREGAR